MPDLVLPWGVFAADLVKDGFTGERDGISTVFGNIAGVFLDIDKILEDLGERWEVGRGYHRLHACARSIHPSLDALISISKAHAVLPEEVERIDVHTYSMAAAMKVAIPENPMAARFSIPHALAAYLILQETGAAISSEEALKNDKIQSLAKRISVKDDQGMTARTPYERPSLVRMVLRDGRILEASTKLPAGESDHRPLGDDELSDKFLNLATASLGQKRANGLLDKLWHIETVQDAGEISPLFTKIQT